MIGMNERTSSDATKPCSTCGEVLALAEFHWADKAADRLRGQCKRCARTSRTAQRDPDWTPACSRCKVRLPDRSGSGQRLCVDCFAQTYEVDDRRSSGSHRPRLKPCSLCGGPKERFASRSRMCSACKPWEHYAKSLRRFGLRPAEYMAILEAQGGACYVCGAAPGAMRLCIDHDHSIPDGRDAVRGLLCGECNYNRLPRFAEDLAMLARAVAYLTDPPARAVLA